ncbi:MAG: porin [Candidatus Omnitrophota bacterium]
MSDLKSELKALKENLAAQSELIKKQAAEIAGMQKRIDELESAKAAKAPAPKDASKGMEERVGALEEKAAREGGLNADYKNGVRFYTDDKKFDLQLGGVVNADASWFRETSKLIGKVGEAKDGAEFRRARFYVAGTVYENFIYKLEYEFVTDPPSLKDAYMGLQNLPYLGTIRVGHMFEPIGLENLTSTKYLEFLEYGVTEAFMPERNDGLCVNSSAFDGRVTWSTGLFYETNSVGKAASNELNWTSRLTGLPWYEDGGEKLLHLGVAYSLRNPEETVTYSSIPEAHLAPNFVNTGAIRANSVSLVAAETALVYGPLSVQGEYIGSIVDRNAGKDLYFQGFYGYASYFITGEHRPFNKDLALFSRLKPKADFSVKDLTWGAWEVLCRYSYIDLKDKSVSGGIMSDVTLGLNWYLNPNMRVMWNYLHSHLNGYGDADMLLTRFQWDF